MNKRILLLYTGGTIGMDHTPQGLAPVPGLLPQLIQAGVAAIKIEGRQRSPAYVAEVTKVWRAAIDSAWSAHEGRGRYSVQPAWDAGLARWAEGQQHTLGAYDRPWR